MKKQRLVIAAAIALLLAGAALVAQERDRLPHAAQPKLQNYVRSTVLTVPYGAETDQIGRSVGRADELPVGPESFAVSGDEVVLLDTVNERVKFFDRQGAVVRDVNVGRGTDLVASGPQEFLVADPISQEIVKITSSTVERVHVTEPVESFGIRRPTIGSARVESTSAPHAEGALSGYDTQLADDHDGRVMNTQTGESFEVHTDEQLGSISPLGVDEGGSIYVVVEELLPTQMPDVRRTVRKFSPDGVLQAVILIPIDNSTFPARDLLVDGAGTIYHLQPRAEQVLVERWEGR